MLKTELARLLWPTRSDADAEIVGTVVEEEREDDDEEEEDERDQEDDVFDQMVPDQDHLPPSFIAINEQVRTF